MTCPATASCSSRRSSSSRSARASSCRSWSSPSTRSAASPSRPWGCCSPSRPALASPPSRPSRPTSHPPAPPPRLSSFWHDLPRDGKLLISTVVLQSIGTGLVLPFMVVYLNEVRGIALETVGLLLALQAGVGIAIVTPVGALIDRVGPRRVYASSLIALVIADVLL